MTPLISLILAYCYAMVTAGCTLFEWQLWGDINVDAYEELSSDFSAWETFLASGGEAYSEVQTREEGVSEIDSISSMSFGNFDVHCRSATCREDYEKAFQATDNIFKYI